MATNEEVLFPKSLVLPSVPVASQFNTAPAGLIFISGATLCFNDGTAVRRVTSA